MEWLCQLFERKETWVLIGIVLGFSLSELSRIIRGWNRRRKLKKALLDELQMNDHLTLRRKITLAKL